MCVRMIRGPGTHRHQLVVVAALELRAGVEAGLQFLWRWCWSRRQPSPCPWVRVSGRLWISAWTTKTTPLHPQPPAQVEKRDSRLCVSFWAVRHWNPCSWAFSLASGQPHALNPNQSRQRQLGQQLRLREQPLLPRVSSFPL